MVRAVLSIVGIVATVAVLIWCFGYTTPQVTTLLPGLNRSVMRTVGLMQGTATENGREPAGSGAGASSGPSGSGPAPADTTSASPGNASSSQPGAANAPSSAPSRSDEPEIIGPDSTAHLNPEHTHDVDQPTPAWATPSGDSAQAFNPNPAAFVPPNPPPAHPHWTLDVGNREFANVVVNRVDADMVTIASDSGAAQIDIALLPGEIRRELHYDPVLAAQAAAARKAQAAAITTSSP